MNELQDNSGDLLLIKIVQQSPKCSKKCLKKFNFIIYK
jgi:hypothetical protein